MLVSRFPHWTEIVDYFIFTFLMDLKINILYYYGVYDIGARNVYWESSKSSYQTGWRGTKNY